MRTKWEIFEFSPSYCLPFLSKRWGAAAKAKQKLYYTPINRMRPNEAAQPCQNCVYTSATLIFYSAVNTQQKPSPLIWRRLGLRKLSS